MSSTSPPNPPLRSGEGGSGSRQRIVTLLAIFPWMLVLFEYLVILPRYDRLFRRFNLHLDDIADVPIKISDWVRSNVLVSFLITFVLMVVSVAMTVAAQSPRISRKRRILMLFLVFAIPCLVFVLTWVGVENTHSRLVEGLNK